MKKIGIVLREKFVKIVLASFIVILTWILLTGILDYEKIQYDFNPILLMIGIIGYMGMIIFAYKKIIPRIVKYKCIPYVLFVIFFIACVCISHYFRVSPLWDMGSVFNIATEYVQNGSADITYLKVYNNNIVFTVLVTIVLKIAQLFNIQDTISFVTLLNSCITTISVILLYIITKQIYDTKKALMVLIIALLTTPLYLHSAIYYNDMISILLTLLNLELLLQIRKRKVFNEKILFQVLLGISIFVSFEIKLTSIIIVIAVIMYDLLHTNWKNTIKNFCIVIPVVLILFVSYKVMIARRITKEDIDTYKIPMYHHIMMGMSGNGLYNEEDPPYTRSFTTYEERKQANIAEIKNRFSQYNANTFLKHLTLKLRYTWHDGLYWAQDKVGRQPIKRGILHEFVLVDGNYTSYYKYFPQIMHFGMLIFILYNAYYMYINQKEDGEKSIDLAFIFSIYGILIFLLIWENRSRYLLALLPIMMLAQLNGIEYLANRKDKE